METPSPDKTSLRRARITAFVFAAITILSLLFLVYAFIQKAESERLMLEVMECEKKYNEVANQLEMERVRAEDAMIRAGALEEQAKQNTK